VGGFEVGAAITAGRVVSLQVTSLNGNLCRVVNPWPGHTLQVTVQGQPAPHAEAEGVVTFKTETGLTYAVAPEDPPTGWPQFAAAEAAPLTYTGPAYLWNVEPAARLTVRLGLGETRESA
jgi:hypothetical protein